MTISTQDAKPRRMFATSTAAVGIAAGLGYVTLEAVAAAGPRGHYCSAHNFIGDLGITSGGTFEGHTIDSPRGCLMNDRHGMSADRDARTLVERGWRGISISHTRPLPAAGR
jgi:hypothetical protein